MGDSVRTETKLWHRWPIPVALATAVGMIVSNGDDSVRIFATVLPLLPLLYLLTVKIGRPRAVWPLLAAGFGLVTVLRLFDPAVYAVIALAVLAWAAVDGDWRERAFQWEALGMLLFGAASVAGLFLDPGVGRWIVGAGWLLHGVWDYAHLRTRTVVAPAYAAWCGIVDVVVGAALLAGF